MGNQKVKLIRFCQLSWKNIYKVMCLFSEFHLQGLRSPTMRSLLVVNEQLLDKRNAANGNLWTNTNNN